MLKSLPLVAFSATALLALSACGEGDGPDDTNAGSSSTHGVVCGQTENGQQPFCLNQGSERFDLGNAAYGLLSPDESDSGEWEIMVYARNEADEACPSGDAAPTEPNATIGPFRRIEETGRLYRPDDVAIALTVNGETRRGSYNDANVFLAVGPQLPVMCTDDCYQQGGGPEFRLSASIFFEGENIALSEDAFGGSMNIPHCPELDGVVADAS